MVYEEELYVYEQTIFPFVTYISISLSLCLCLSLSLSLY